MKRLLIVLLSLALSSTMLAQDRNGDGNITYLVPISIGGTIPGASGTLWNTELWLRHEAEPFYLRLCVEGSIQITCGGPAHAAGVTQQAYDFEQGGRSGAVMYHIGAPNAATLSLSARLYERSRHTQPDGVNIPVVREDQFFSTPKRFLSVPVTGRRAAVRVYDPRRRVGASVRIEVLTLAGESLGEVVLPFAYGDRSTDPGIAAVLDLAGAFPRLAGIDRFDIRVTPADGIEYWAMVSVTDNETQQVMLITATE